MLIDHGKRGFLVQPGTEEEIAAEMASYLDQLAEDGELAERMSVQGRLAAEQWRWSNVMQQWCGHYQAALTAK